MSSRERLLGWAGFALLLAWGSFALFSNLGEAYLWGDEAETALLGQTILAGGVPRGELSGWAIRPEYPATSNADGVWVWNTWLSPYLAAASFKIFGVSAFSARFPFALAGLISLLVAAPVFRKISGDPFTAWLGAGLMATSVPYLLYMRQCHYYSLAALGSLGVLGATWMLQEGRAAGAALFAGALAFLFHCFFPFAYGAAVAPVTWVLSRPGHPKSRRLLFVALAAAACLCLPSFVYQKAWSRPPERLQSAAAAWSHFNVYLLWINQFLFPGLLLAALALRRARIPQGSVLAAFILIPIIQFSWAGADAYTRFIIGTFPAVFLLLALGLVRAAGARRWAAAAAAALLALSNGAHILPVKIGSLFRGEAFPAPASFTEAMKFKLAALPLSCFPARFLEELAGSYDGPTESMLSHLKAHSEPGDTLLTTSEALPARFHAPEGLRILHPHEADKAPDWIAPTRWLAFDETLSRRIQGWVKGGYEARALAVPDLLWENHPDILYHHFRVPAGAGKILYRRLKLPGR